MVRNEIDCICNVVHICFIVERKLNIKKVTPQKNANMVSLWSVCG